MTVVVRTMLWARLAVRSDALLVDLDSDACHFAGKGRKGSIKAALR